MAAMSDTSGTRVDLTAPLPGGDASAVLRWRAARGGLRGDGDADRLSATHATLETVDLDGRRRERRLDLSEADAYLAEARAIHERARTISAGAAQRKDEHRAAREQLAATLDVTCARCAQPREYRGRRHLMAVQRPEQFGRLEDLGLARPGLVVHHEYACPRCGSIELFADGFVDHPVASAAPVS